MGSSDEPGGRMAIGTSREGGKAACAIVHSASDGLITCGHGEIKVSKHSGDVEVRRRCEAEPRAIFTAEWQARCAAVLL